MEQNRRAVAQLIALVAALVFVLAACGSDEDDASDDTSDSSETTASETSETTAPETTEAETTAPETTAPETTASSAAETSEDAGGAVPIELAEWSISDPGELSAGTINFALSNTGENPHAFAIARGVRYEDLPQKSNGAVDTDALGDDYLGTSDNVPSGEAGAVEFELAAGDYVFFCPIEFGPNSHAGAGQVLSVTVGE